MPKVYMISKITVSPFEFAVSIVESTSRINDLISANQPSFLGLLQLLTRSQ